MIEIEDIDYSKKETIPLDQRPSISLLLGAGFSVPMGYPTGKELNDKIQEFNKLPVDFDPSGIICEGNEGNKPDFGWTNPYQNCFKCCIALIHEYAKHNIFDYEQFMDFIQGKQVYDDIYKSIGEHYLNGYNSYESLVDGIPNIYAQMVDYLLKDLDGDSWYDNKPNHIGKYLEYPLCLYNGFLEFLQSIMNDYVINVHTLNHDLFFESFNKSDYVSGAICDGFDEYHSPFYGRLDIEESDKIGKRSYICRLKRYTGRYYGDAIRLYKLHGSVDYAVFHRNKYALLKPSNEIKLQHKINAINLLREKRRGSGYEKDVIFHQSDFLTGVTTKMQKYNSKVFYKKIFKKFHNNLHNAETLIIIGYGGKDQGINNDITQYFNYEHKTSYIIDPCINTNDNLKLLADRIHAKKLDIGVDGIKKDTFSFRKFRTPKLSK